LAAPNPYLVYSFLQRRKVMGRGVRHLSATQEVCRARDLARSPRHAHHDVQLLGGGAGHVVLKDPAKEGLQHDPRQNPRRHAMAILRLRSLRRLGDPFGRKPAAREALPQREKPQWEAPTRKPVPLPVRTFRQALEFGLGLRIHCPRCHDWRPIELDAAQLPLCLPVPQAQGLWGRPQGLRRSRRAGFRARRAGRPRPGLRRSRMQRPPPKAASSLGDQPHRPRRAALGGPAGDGERFRCLGCGGIAHHTFPYAVSRKNGEPGRPAAGLLRDDRPSFS
jgi:hypothetical protein